MTELYPNRDIYGAVMELIAEVAALRGRVERLEKLMIQAGLKEPALEVVRIIEERLRQEP